MSTYEINHPGTLTAAAEYRFGPFASDITISRFVPAVSQPPAGGTCVVRVQDGTGASPSEFIEATIADGQTVATAATGTVGVPAGSVVFVRIVSNAGGAEFLRGHFDFTAAILGTPGGSDLCTVGDVKSWLGITGASTDGLIQIIVSGVSQAMQREMSREINRTTRDEFYDGPGYFDSLVLRHAPVLEDQVALTVQVDGAAVADADFFVDTEAGLVIRTNGSNLETPVPWSQGRRNIRVQYQSGYTSVPPELRDLAIQRAAYEVKQSTARGDRLGEVQAVLGSTTVTYVSREAWMASVRSDLRKWRRLAF